VAYLASKSGLETCSGAAAMSLLFSDTEIEGSFVMMPRKQRPIRPLYWLKRWWLEWRIRDTQAEIQFWLDAGMDRRKMVALRQYEEALVCELAEMK
jgi:hypothetical protein